MASGKCAKCGVWHRTLHADHIEPICKGGTSDGPIQRLCLLPSGPPLCGMYFRTVVVRPSFVVRLRPASDVNSAPHVAEKIKELDSDGLSLEDNP
jgi:hypothetical protein